MKLIFATHNKNKLQEVQALMPQSIELLSLDDIGCFEEIPETADTIDGNAILKADHIKEHYRLDCFADDTGLEVEALHGAPGVYSARYAGEGKSNEDNVQKLLEELKDEDNRRAQFKTVIALNLHDHQFLFQGICTGTITREKRGDKGFGYDPVFQPDGSNKTFAQMSMEEKAILSHRGKALRDLIEYLSK
ncbi:non-canonical purine NTP diphosphatase [Antarcticibacterium flavum]|uniref:dITP/XTP pyrophosphatase n=1 Tax=Antarcticibacterium flavum TaxID=2058175 RepID=A0A5B7X155_9FLAO|nr:MULTISPECIES: non-canonical purine NTP diphosphatase [Antarcticibacterium]MCM4161161.1 non-canonical purine NTP pyrophosphatase [Antarcticibacterium sp. W02-3]QCY68333.1 non-canonical purine NTP diphosphatase [Antarcticibacterium flavum]